MNIPCTTEDVDTSQEACYVADDVFAALLTAFPYLDENTLLALSDDVTLSLIGGNWFDALHSINIVLRDNPETA